MLWVKAFHLVAMVSWFAGLFYLPRLFVYHAGSDDATSTERFKVMERKLYWGIMTPAAIVTVALGVWLVTFNPSYYMSSGWFHTKLLLVFLLLGYHHACGRLLKKFALDLNSKSPVFYRWFNEFPVVLLVAIAILVIVKPF